MWPYGQSTFSREEGTSHIPVCILKAKSEMSETTWQRHCKPAWSLNQNGETAALTWFSKLHLASYILQRLAAKSN